MITPSEPSISLRSWLANNSKGRCSWRLFLKSEELKTRQFLWVDYLTSETLSGTNHFQQLYNLRFLKKTPNHRRILNASKFPLKPACPVGRGDDHPNSCFG